MKMPKKRLIAAGLAIIIAISTVFGYLTYNSYAARVSDWELLTTTASFRDFSRMHDIPETTIFIGVHLIKLECATDELWEQAVESQQTYEQEKIYYKSELAGGIWYEITDAESIRDIDGSGTPVDESELADLRVRYYTFDYGITRWFQGTRHCIFDGDYNYWDLYHLEELQSIRDQYDVIVSRNNEKSDMDKFYRQFLGDFFQYVGNDIRNSVCKDADEALYALQDVYDALVAADRKDDADIIYKLMSKLDNLRRSEIFKQLIDEDYSLNMDYLTPWLYKNFRNILDEVLSKCGGEGFAVWAAQYADDEDVDFVVNNAVIDAIGTAIGECTAAYNAKLSNVLDPNGSREIDALIYEVSNRIIEGAQGGLTPEIDGDITRLGHLLNIEDEKIVHKDEELAIIDGELLSPVTAKFRNAAMAGPSEDYNTALNAGVSDSSLSAVLELQEFDLDFIRLELQDVIKAKVDRMEVEDAMAFVYDRINMMEGMKASVPDTDFASNAISQIQRHIEWLSKLLADLYEGSKSGNSELDKLNAEADSLLEKQQQALDDNDYRRAKEFEEARKVVLDKIDNMTGQLMNKINDPNANAGEKALAKAILDGGHDGMDKLLQNIVDDALNKQSNGEDISNDIDLLSALGYTDGLNQLGVTAGTGDDGSGSGFGKGISADELLALLISVVGEIDSLSSTRLAECIRAMEILYDMGYDGAGTLAARLANIAVIKGNKHLYGQINDAGSTEYVNIETLSWVAGFRYAYDNSKRTGTLIGTGIKTTYQFVAGDRTIYEAVNRDTVNPVFKEFKEMSTNVRLYRNGLFAPVNISEEYYNSLACHIKKSEYGICITSKMEGEAKTLVEQLLPLIEGTN